MDADDERMDPGLNSISLVLSTGAREESILPLPQPPPPPHGPRPPGRRLHSPQVTTRKVRHQAASGWLFITPSPRPLSLPRSRRRRRRRQVGCFQSFHSLAMASRFDTAEAREDGPLALHSWLAAASPFLRPARRHPSA